MCTPRSVLITLPIKTDRDIWRLSPCYEGRQYIPYSWSGTVLDVVKASKVPPEHRVWVALHWISDNLLLDTVRYALLTYSVIEGYVA